MSPHKVLGAHDTSQQLLRVMLAVCLVLLTLVMAHAATQYASTIRDNTLITGLVGNWSGNIAQAGGYAQAESGGAFVSATYNNHINFTDGQLNGQILNWTMVLSGVNASGAMQEVILVNVSSAPDVNQNAVIRFGLIGSNFFVFNGSTLVQFGDSYTNAGSSMIAQVMITPINGTWILNLSGSLNKSVVGIRSSFNMSNRSAALSYELRANASGFTKVANISFENITITQGDVPVASVPLLNTTIAVYGDGISNWTVRSQTTGNRTNVTMVAMVWVNRTLADNLFNNTMNVSFFEVVNNSVQSFTYSCSRTNCSRGDRVYIELFANDTDSISNFTNSSILLISDSLPEINLSAPLAGNTSKYPWRASWVASDNDSVDISSEVVNYSFRLNDTVHTIGLLDSNLSFSVLANGSSNWSIVVFDRAGNSTTSAVRNFNIDGVPAGVFNVTSAGAVSSFSVNFTVNESVNYHAIIYGASLQTISTVAPASSGCALLCNLTVFGVATETQFFFIFNTTDVFGNIGNSSIFNVSTTSGSVPGGGGGDGGGGGAAPLSVTQQVTVINESFAINPPYIDTPLFILPGDVGRGTFVTSANRKMKSCKPIGAGWTCVVNAVTKGSATTTLDLDAIGNSNVVVTEITYEAEDGAIVKQNVQVKITRLDVWFAVKLPITVTRSYYIFHIDQVSGVADGVYTLSIVVIFLAIVGLVLIGGPLMALRMLLRR